MKKKIFSALGLMTGTSMDGVDLSLIQSDGSTEFIPILNDYCEFNGELREKLIELRNKIFISKDLKKFFLEIKDLEKEFTLFNCKFIDKIFKNSNHQIDIIGFHGQTIFHNSKEKISKQLADGMLLSQITKKKVINNFRKEDLINGGQGAPLAPIFHKLISNILFKKKRVSFPLNIINIGGITNLTQILDFNNSKDTNIFAYDIGPGNCLIDEWIRKKSKKKFDDNGEIAKSGKVNNLVFNQAIDNFELKVFDKSLDIKDFDISFVKGLSLEDGCATLTKFSAHLIAKGIINVNNLNNLFPNYNLVCGGGRKNSFLIESINEELLQEKNKLENIDKYNFDGDFIESQAFAYLSIRSFLNLPISFPDTTRCNSPTICGTLNKNF
jgi:anhydro-N-acetylmuramic acid kinase